jgi:hypothetical protein
MLDLTGSKQSRFTITTYLSYLSHVAKVLRKWWFVAALSPLSVIYDVSQIEGCDFSVLSIHGELSLG